MLKEEKIVFSILLVYLFYGWYNYTGNAQEFIVPFVFNYLSCFLLSCYLTFRVKTKLPMVLLSIAFGIQFLFSEQLLYLINIFSKETVHYVINPTWPLIGLLFFIFSCGYWIRTLYSKDKKRFTLILIPFILYLISLFVYVDYSVYFFLAFCLTQFLIVKSSNLVNQVYSFSLVLFLLGCLEGLTLNL